MDKQSVQILDYNKREFFCQVDLFAEGEVRLKDKRGQHLLRAIFAQKTEFFGVCWILESEFCETFGTEKGRNERSRAGRGSEWI